MGIAPQNAGGALEKMASSGFLQYLSLMVGTSKPCITGEVPINVFALRGGPKTIALDVETKETDAVLCALRFSWTNSKEGLFLFSNTATNRQDANGETVCPLCLEIEGNSRKKNSGCFYGPDFLIWIPGEECFASFSLSSYSARREAASFGGFLGKGVTLFPRKLHSKKEDKDYYIPGVRACSSIDPMPTPEVLKDEIGKFLLAPSTDVKAADEGEDTGRER
jgi:hypothetical protein